MRELGRILSRPRLVLGLALIALLNGLLFVREQGKRDYGLDLELPSGGFVIFDGSFNVPQEPVDAKAAYGRYARRLGQVRGMPLVDAAELLEGEKKTLSEKLAGDDATPDDKLDYVAVNNLLAQTDYLTGYGDWLENIQDNKENLLTFSIFNDPRSFSGRNILKTAEEFEKLQNIELALGADGAVEAFMTFPLTDYFLLLALLLVSLSFLDERKAGLWSVVHASPRGRLCLAARRTAILFGASAVTVPLLYGANLVLGFAIYGGVGDLGRAVQSVEALGRLPLLTTVGGFLLRFLLLRIAAAFLVGLLLWLMLTAVNNVKYTVIVSAAALAVEYGLYTFLPVQSAFNILKYFNLFTYISLSDLYVNYLNIDILGFPLGIRSISQLALGPLCALSAAACMAVQCRKKPAAGRDLLGRAAYALNSVTDRLLARLRLFGMELHKTMWIQRGIVVAAVLIYVAVGLDFTVAIPPESMEDMAAAQYTTQLAGPITDETFDWIDVELSRLESDMAAYEDAKDAYSGGLIDYPELDKYARAASSAQTKSKGLSKVRDRCSELCDRGESEGFAPWLVDETPFAGIYGPRAESRQYRAALVCLLALTLLLAGSMAYERQSGMTFLLRSTPRGRFALLLRKLLSAALMTTLVWAAVYGAELYALLSGFCISSWSAPVKNLDMLSRFPLPCPVGCWLALLYVCRWLALYCCGLVVLSISALMKRTQIATVAATAVMLVPSLLYVYVGIGSLRPLSFILPVAAAPPLTSANGALSGLLPCSPVLAATALAALIVLILHFGAPRRHPLTKERPEA